MTCCRVFFRRFFKFLVFLETTRTDFMTNLKLDLMLSSLLQRVYQ